MGAAAVVAGVLAQLEELLDVEVPGFQVGADRALALAALVDRDGGVVDDLQERHDALDLAVGALDVGAERAHRVQSLPRPPANFDSSAFSLMRLVDAVEVVGHGRQVAATTAASGSVPALNSVGVELMKSNVDSTS